MLNFYMKAEPYIVNAGHYVHVEYRSLDIKFECTGAGYPTPTFDFRRKGESKCYLNGNK